MLLAYLVQETGDLYGRWVHTIGREPGKSALTATIRVSFSREDTLRGASGRLARDVLLVRELRAGRVPRPLPLRMAVDAGFPHGQAEVVLRVRARIMAMGLRNHVTVLPASSAGDPVAVEVRVSGGAKSVIRVALPVDVASLRMAFANELYEGDDGLGRLACDVLVGVAFVLSRTGATTMAARLVKDAARGSVLATQREVAEVLSAVMFEHDMTDEAEELAAALMLASDPDLRDVGDVYWAATRTHASKDPDRMLDVLERRVRLEETSPNPRRAGRVHYNSANLLMSLGRLTRAAAEFGLALLFDPGYAERSYFYRERGGVLWLLDRFEEAACDYEDALRTGADPGEVRPLLADAYKHAGMYAAALDVLRGWEPTGHDLDRLAYLNRVALTELLDVVGLEEQTRRPAELKQIVEADTGERLIELLRGTDALDPRIWLGLLGDPPSMQRALLVALTLEHDARAWALTTAITVAEILEHNGEDYGGAVTLMHLVVSAARLCDEVEYVAAFEQVIQDGDPDWAERARIAFYSSVSAVPQRSGDPAIRLIIDP